MTREETGYQSLSDWCAVEGELWDCWEAAGKPAGWDSFMAWLFAQRRADSMRVRGYLEVVRRRRVSATKRLDGALSIVDRMPRAAAIALDVLTREVDDEEILMKVVAQNDPVELAVVARALEELERDLES